MILFLVPSKMTGGVYDFACRLHVELNSRDVQLVPLSKDNEAAWKVSKGDTVVLQMSGYGFAKRGDPLWLLRAIVKRRGDFKTLGVFFHELYAFGPPWTSSFWFSPVQRYIVRRLAELSDFWMTNREGSARWLRQYAGDKPNAVLPVFSTIGEPPSRSRTRKPAVIVFGSAELRKATYRAAGEKLFAWAKGVPLEVHDVGTPITDKSLNEIPQRHGVIQHGRLDDAEVGQLMANATFGLIAYPVDYLAKSSVFAAYCAHGLCPVVISEKYPLADGLEECKHYMPGIPKDDVTTDAEAVGHAAWKWYQPHSLSNHAEAVESFMLKRITVCDI